MIMRSTVLLVLLVGVGAWALKPPAHGCPGSHPALKNITIVYSAAGIIVAPPIAIAHESGVLRFNLFGTTGKVVCVQGKTPNAAWISECGSNLKFYVCVPPGQAEGDYYYKVEAAGSPPLDPMVRIR